MSGWIDETRPLPFFREDLELYHGPDEYDGSPSFNLLDPTKGKYYKINWGESLIFQNFKPGMTLDDLHEAIHENTTLKITKEDIKSFFEEAGEHNLLTMPRSSESVAGEWEKTRGSFFRNLIYNYLYFRIPIINPDKFLEKTLPYVKLLASRPAIIAYTILSVIGTYLVITNLGEFFSTFNYFFSFEGILSYALTISVLKIIHEFAHAYTAKYFGVNVPAMGVIFIVMWPMLYTDVTNGWKLWKRSSRLAISGAGVIAELVLAGISSLGWALTEPGILNSVFFLIASATWISSIFINWNPAMRFDGYYLACDITGVDNLQPRSFAVTRWKMLDLLFGVKLEPPEGGLTKKRIFWMVFYTIFTWIYRFFLYISVAIFVYFVFTKALGITLAIVEIWIFLLSPVIGELLFIKKTGLTFKNNRRLMITSMVFSGFMMWFIIPFPHTITFEAITAPKEKQVVYVPEDSVVEKVFVERGQRVTKGEPIIQLYSHTLGNEIKNLKLETEIVETQLQIISLNIKDPSFIPRKKEELDSTKANLKRATDLNSQLDVRAHIDGRVYAWNDLLKPGVYLPKNAIIGKIADPKKVVVWAYVPENEVEFVQIGKEVTFTLRNSVKQFKGEVIAISPTNERILQFPALASIYNGPLAVSNDRLISPEGLMKLQRSYYPVKIKIDIGNEQIPFEQRGKVTLRGPWRSKFVSLLRWLTGIFWRESGF